MWTGGEHWLLGTTVLNVHVRTHLHWAFCELRSQGYVDRATGLHAVAVVGSAGLQQHTSLGSPAGTDICVPAAGKCLRDVDHCHWIKYGEVN